LKKISDDKMTGDKTSDGSKKQKSGKSNKSGKPDDSNIFWGNIFSTKYDLVVAICDDDIIEKRIGSNPRIKVSKSFYGGKLMDEQLALRIMKRATIGNLIGNRIVDVAERGGFITRENVILIGGVPHAQFVKT